jgi:tetratricopeptide (TPR) repeat protein
MNRQPEQAILELRGARARFDEVLDQRSLIDALDWEGMALFLLDDPLCLPVLLDALGRSRGLSPGGELLRVRILTHIATVHVSRHAWRDAIRYYEEASRTSENLRDLAQIARAYDGLSQAYASLGQSARAIAYANKALALYATQSDLAGLSRAENNLGDLLLRLDEVDAAEPHLRRALEGCQSMGLDRRGSGYVLVNLAEVAYRRGDSDEARRLIAQAVDLARELGERVVQANSELLLARISAQTRDPREADRHFNSAIELLQDLEMPDRMREAHLEYGRLLRKRGLIAEAADQFELAAEVQSRGSDVGSLEAWA